MKKNKNLKKTFKTITEYEKLKDYFNQEFEKFLTNDLKKFEKNLSISKTNKKHLTFFYELIKDYALNNGKRLRPIFLILTYKIYSKKVNSNREDSIKKILLPSFAIELIHTYSLILDDIMDEDEFRRNKKTVYKKVKDYYLENFKEINYNGSLFNKRSNKFANSFSIMLGNLTRILATECLINSDFSSQQKLKAIKLLEETDKLIYQGQMLDILFENITYNNTSFISEKDYIKMIVLKTGVLFSLCFELGLLLAHNNQKNFSNNKNLINQIEKIKKASLYWAIAFQINDDILDIDMNNKKGHEIGSDLKKQKKTLLLIKALDILKKNNDNDKIKFLLNLNPDSSNEEIKKAIQIINETSLSYVKNLKDRYYKNSKKLFKETRLHEIFNFLEKFI
ncbi:MAG: polyprenyl synthetase family protein [Candidatus Woesearchaeota archaeon]